MSSIGCPICLIPSHQSLLYILHFVYHDGDDNDDDEDNDNHNSMSVLLIVGPKMYAGRNTCCPLVSHDVYANGTDRWTPDRYITLSAVDTAGVMMTATTTTTATVITLIIILN